MYFHKNYKGSLTFSFPVSVSLVDTNFQELNPSDGNKSLLHSDATRLFTSLGTGGENEVDWDTQYDKSYRSRTQAARHYARDGAAFASVALPAHYSAITAVLHHLKLRLGSVWEVNNIIDWGAGTGSGLW